MQSSFSAGGATMSPAARAGFVLIAGAVATFGLAAQAQQNLPVKPTALPNPYRLAEGWPSLPLSMNGGQWGEVIRVHVHRDGNIWVFHRCFNTVPPGHATCVGRGDSNPPILQFDPAGRLLASLGVGLFAYPHGFTVDDDGNLWTSDVNDEAVILGLSAKTAEGAVKGPEVLKLSPDGADDARQDGRGRKRPGHFRPADRDRGRAERRRVRVGRPSSQQ